MRPRANVAGGTEVEPGPQCSSGTVQTGPHGSHRYVHGHGDALVGQVRPGVEQQRFPVYGRHSFQAASDASGRHNGVHLGGNPVRIVGDGFPQSRFSCGSENLGFGAVVPPEQVCGDPEKPRPGILPVQIVGFKLFPGDQKGLGCDVVGGEITGPSCGVSVDN